MGNIRYILRKDGDCERPCVLWAWLDRLQAEDIVYQMHKFKEAGIEEVYIEPVWMIEVDDYLSDFFMDMIKLAADTAEELGMKYSIYDDFDWPSGNCAGKVLEKYPFTRMTYLKWFRKDAQAGEPLEILFKGELLAVKAEYTDKMKKREDITDKVTVESFAGGEYGRVIWKNKNCCAVKVWVFCKVYAENIGATKWSTFTNNTRGFTDSMNKEAMRLFLEMNHEVYRKKLGDKFGKSIPRAFSDETPLGDFIDMDLNMMPYSIVFEEEFQKEHGYAVRDNFIALTRVSERDEDIKVRYDYHCTCTRLFREAFIDQVSDWLHQNGLEWTGHLSGSSNLYLHSIQQGDYYVANSGFDIPGMDSILSHKNVNADDFGANAKILASLAKFAGKDRTICETFSGSGWEMNMEDAKRIINNIMLRGITYIMYNSASYSLSEGRKAFPIGYMPTFGFNNPVFRHYGKLTDYTAIRSSLLVQTKPCGNALIMLPQIDAWLHPDISSRHSANGIMDLCWFSCTLALQKKSVDHDIFFEAITDELKIENGKATVKGYSYDTVVVPCMRYSKQATLDKLEEFAKQGGRLVFVEKFPFSAADTAKKYDFPAICGLSEEGRSFFAQKGGYAVRTEGNVMLIRLQERKFYATERFRNDISSFVKSGGAENAVECDEIPDGVYIARRAAKGLCCALILNNTSEAKTVTLRINSSDDICLLEGETVRECTAKGGRFTLELPPHEMPIVMLKAKGVELEAPKAEAKEKPCGKEHTVQFDSEWHFTTVENNMLPLRIRYLTKAEPCKKLSAELLKQAETANVPFACHEFPAGQGLEFGDGYAAYARFEVKDIPEYLELFNEVVDEGELWLNGHLLSGFKKVFEWGVRDSVTEITPYVKQGTNTLVMINRIPAWEGPHQMPWAVVRGNFRLENDVITVSDDRVEPDIYTAQGWQYFGGNCSYKGSFTLGEKDRGTVVIKVDTRDVTEVLINGKNAGKLCWEPYELDITDCCRLGKNTVELKITTNYQSAMTLESVELAGQGVTVYKDEVPVQRLGLLSAPKITITENDKSRRK